MNTCKLAARMCLLLLLGVSGWQRGFADPVVGIVEDDGVSDYFSSVYLVDALSLGTLIQCGEPVHLYEATQIDESTGVVTRVTLGLLGGEPLIGPLDHRQLGVVDASICEGDDAYIRVMLTGP